MTHAKVIAALKAAPEGSRKLSDQVLIALGWRKERYIDMYTLAWRTPDSSEEFGMGPDPTRSFDDALALAKTPHELLVALSQSVPAVAALMTYDNRKGPTNPFKFPAIRAMLIALIEARKK